MRKHRTFQVERVAYRMNTAMIASTDGMVSITIKSKHEAMHEGLNNDGISFITDHIVLAQSLKSGTRTPTEIRQWA
jgi:hypothetical protein